MGPVAEAAPRPSESFILHYSRIARATPGRRFLDVELRVLDVLFAGAFLVLLALLCVLIAIAILLSSGRPVIYRGERVGRSGRIFTMHKFRTLRADAEARLGPHLGPALV